jgi:hypothetical protein
MNSYTKRMSKSIKKMLKNEIVMYIVLSVAIVNMMGYLMVNNINAIILLFLVGFLTSFFSENMVVVMLTAVLFTNLIVGSEKVSRRPLLEGMEDTETTSTTTPTTTPTTTDDGDDDSDDDYDGDDDGDDDGEGEEFKLRPAALNESDDAAELDFPGSIEAAYDNLDKLLSSDAINKMSKDTQNLADKQKKLMGNIDKLGPLMENAQNMMNGLNTGKINKLISGFSKLKVAS